jgi:hypothetical protein
MKFLVQVTDENDPAIRDNLSASRRSGPGSRVAKASDNKAKAAGKKGVARKRSAQVPGSIRGSSSNRAEIYSRFGPVYCVKYLRTI